jgi:hypothetical protein
MQQLQIIIQMNNMVIYDPIDRGQDELQNMQQFLRKHLQQMLYMD